MGRIALPRHFSRHPTLCTKTAVVYGLFAQRRSRRAAKAALASPTRSGTRGEGPKPGSRTHKPRISPPARIFLWERRCVCLPLCSCPDPVSQGVPQSQCTAFPQVTAGESSQYLHPARVRCRTSEAPATLLAAGRNSHRTAPAGWLDRQLPGKPHTCSGT